MSEIIYACSHNASHVRSKIQYSMDFTVLQSSLEVKKNYMSISYLWNHPLESSKDFGNNFKIPRGPKSKIYYIKFFTRPFLVNFY